MKLRHLAVAAFSITTAFAADDESNLVLLDTQNPAIRDLAVSAGDVSTYDSLNEKNKIGVFFSEGFRNNSAYYFSCHLLRSWEERSSNTWRVGDFSNADDSALFMMNKLPNDTRYLPLSLIDALGSPWPWKVMFDDLTWPAIGNGHTYQDFQNHVNASLGDGASAGQIQIFKRFEFPSGLNYTPKGSGLFGGVKDYDTDRANISNAARKFVIVLHGWNTSPMQDPYADGDWKPFFDSLRSEMVSKSALAESWDLYAYQWGQDSYTGNVNGNDGPLSLLSLRGLSADADKTHLAGGVGAGVENGTQAAEIGYQHGLVLGKLIWEHCHSRGISPEKIHFIAHSAGTWVARSASLYLNAKYGNSLKQQITLLDPYNPRAGYHEWIAMGPNFPSNVDNSDLRTDLINSWVGEVAPVDMWENIYSMDERVSGTNSLYGGAFVNRQVGASAFGIDGSETNFDAHAGPIRYYTFSLNPSYEFEVMADGRRVFPSKAWAKSTKEHVSEVGWEESMFMADYRAHLPPLQQQLAHASSFSVLRSVLPQPQPSPSGPQYAPAPPASPWQQILVDVDSVGWVRAMLLPTNGGAAELAGPVRPEPDGTFSIDLSDGTVLAGVFDTSVTPVAITLTIDGVPFGQKVEKAQGTLAQAGFDAQLNAAGNMVFSMVLADGTAGMAVAKDADNTGWEGAGVGTVDANGAFTVTGVDGLQVTGQLQEGGGLDPQAIIVAPPQVPEIFVMDATSNSLTMGTASLSCGSVQLSGSSSALAITIKNTGTVDLTDLAVSIDGTNADDFAVTALGTTSLAPDTSVTLNVIFTPGASGSRTARVRVVSNDANEDPFDIALTGQGFTATSMAAAGGEVSGMLTAGAEDFYRVTASGSGILIIWSEGGTDTYGTLLNSGGAVLDQDNDSDLQKNFRASTVVTAGDYFISVKGGIAATAGDYTVRSRFISDQEPIQISFLERTGDGVNLGFTNIPGVVYNIQGSDNLGNWTTMETVTGEGAEMLVPLSGMGSAPAAFLRVSYPVGP